MSNKSSRVQQICTVYADNPVQFQDEINELLKRLGDAVIQLEIIPGLLPGFSAIITYWGKVGEI